ncbi:unnamed protein product [Pedinophyceae sp. YPF-701]|nr:unnamed protein product [Pedinophyceae sp. YPF-701]
MHASAGARSAVAAPQPRFCPTRPAASRYAPGNALPCAPSRAAGAPRRPAPSRGLPRWIDGLIPGASPSQEVETAEAAQGQQVTVSVAGAMSEVGKDEWNNCANRGGEGEVNPFLQWEFLHALEESGSVCRQTGWLPQHLLVRGPDGALIGCCPLYAKGHSMGEYVFDQGWAEFSESIGQSYYPKLQACVPFTPVTGARLLTVPGPLEAPVRDAMGSALVQVAQELSVSGTHVTFNTRAEWDDLHAKGFMKRMGVQYHWQNNGYETFDEFLMSLKQSRRKSIRQERKRVGKEGIRVRRSTGAELKPRHWDAFYQFYLSTVEKRWGNAYLTQDFFHMLGETMPDSVLMVFAEEDGTAGPGAACGPEGTLVAGAINLVGSHAIFGRNWGSRMDRYVKNLHFEVCYYQAIEAAIEAKLERVEAGAQGEHKIQRGYLPRPTFSSHYIRDPTVRMAVGRFLAQERDHMEDTIELLRREVSPYKDDVHGVVTSSMDLSW